VVDPGIKYGVGIEFVREALRVTSEALGTSERIEAQIMQVLEREQPEQDREGLRCLRQQLLDSRRQLSDALRGAISRLDELKRQKQ
jgi:hypothetical protein